MMNLLCKFRLHNQSNKYKERSQGLCSLIALNLQKKKKGAKRLGGHRPKNRHKIRNRQCILHVQWGMAEQAKTDRQILTAAPTKFSGGIGITYLDLEVFSKYEACTILVIQAVFLCACRHGAWGRA